MRATIVVTDDSGKQYSATVDLAALTARGAAGPARAGGPSTEHPKPKLDFSLSCRAFVKAHVHRQTTGAQKFVILVAWLAKGQTTAETRREDISREWKKASGLLGGEMANVYSTRAKDSGWVDSPKTGVYVLRGDWMKAFGR